MQTWAALRKKLWYLGQARFYDISVVALKMLLQARTRRIRGVCPK